MTIDSYYPNILFPSILKNKWFGFIHITSLKCKTIKSSTEDRRYINNIIMYKQKV